MDVLEEVDVLLCEDTRKTGLLLAGLGIANKPKLISFYDEVERQKIPQVVEMLKEGLEVGLVTDAGTPLISDPGWLLVKKCQELGLPYTALPGASAVINALVLSGLPSARFCFLGFLPKKEGDIKKIINISSYSSMELEPCIFARVISRSPAIIGYTSGSKVLFFNCGFECY